MFTFENLFIYLKINVNEYNNAKLTLLMNLMNCIQEMRYVAEYLILILIKEYNKALEQFLYFMITSQTRNHYLPIVVNFPRRGKVVSTVMEWFQHQFFFDFFSFTNGGF